MNYLTDASKGVRHLMKVGVAFSGPLEPRNTVQADIILKSGLLACPLWPKADLGECNASGDVCLTPIADILLLITSLAMFGRLKIGAAF